MTVCTQWAGRSIALGTFPIAEAKRKAEEAKQVGALTKKMIDDIALEEDALGADPAGEEHAYVGRCHTIPRLERQLSRDRGAANLFSDEMKYLDLSGNLGL